MKQEITACAFIHKKFDGVEKVFLAKRAKTKKFLPDVYELLGGHIERGESSIDGLKREIKEELGMKIEIGDSFFTFSYDGRDSQTTETIYFAQFAEPIENIKLNSEDHSESNWFAENEIGKIISENKRGNDPEIQAIRKGFELLKEN